MSIENVMAYAQTLVGLPYRWYTPNEVFEGNNKFWADNNKHVTAEYIKKNDKCIVCTGLINLMRRYMNLRIPGTEDTMDISVRDLYKDCPGGTGAWFVYLQNNNRLEKINRYKSYPKGTLLLAPWISDIGDQGHAAVVLDKSKTLIDQKIIHARPTLECNECNVTKNHGSLEIESFISYDKGTYFKYVCYPENWLLID